MNLLPLKTKFSQNTTSRRTHSVEANEDVTYQTLLGFGGAFTDAAGVNMASLPSQLQENLLRSYYSREGLEYNLGRIPIGGTDFSTRPYTYDDLPEGETDVTLKKFQLQEEDLTYKVPYIQKVKSMSEKKVKFYASPWSAPAWMKENGQLNGKGGLLKKYYPVWANYIVKFLKEYSNHGIDVFAITTQNEPINGLINKFPFNALGWTSTDQAEWVGEHLGPQLQNSGYKNVSVFILDDNRFFLPTWVENFMKNSKAAQYVNGIAVHWYLDWFALASVLDVTHTAFPNLPILYTEACHGSLPFTAGHVMLGDWHRAEQYASDIIENLQHWVVGWTDWNLALNMEGGPNWVNNFVDSPIIVNAAQKEYYKQPMYFALAHFTKVLPEGSQRIELRTLGKMDALVPYVAFKTPVGLIVVIVLNKSEADRNFKVVDGDRVISVVLEARSINSFVWNSLGLRPKSTEGLSHY